MCKLLVASEALKSTNCLALRRLFYLENKKYRLFERSPLPFRTTLFALQISHKILTPNLKNNKKEKKCHH
jgi:hypothetical protein